MNNLILRAQQEPYGRFGHQSYNFLTAYILAKISGCGFYGGRYLFRAENFNSCIDWNIISNIKGEPVFCSEDFNSYFRSSKYARSFVQNKSLDGDANFNNIELSLSNKSCKTTGQLKSIIDALNELSIIYADRAYPTVIDLPFNFLDGILGRLIGCYLSEIRKIYLVSNIEQKQTVAIHLRRGDAGKGNNLLVDPELQAKKIPYILENHLPKDIDVHIFTQAHSSSELNYLIEKIKGRKLHLHLDKGEDLLINTNDVDHFKLMIESKYIILGNSTYSYMAAYLGNHEKAFSLSDGPIENPTINNRGFIQI